MAVGILRAPGWVNTFLAFYRCPSTSVRSLACRPLETRILTLSTPLQHNLQPDIMREEFILIQQPIADSKIQHKMKLIYSIKNIYIPLYHFTHYNRFKEKIYQQRIRFIDGSFARIGLRGHWTVMCPASVLRPAHVEPPCVSYTVHGVIAKVHLTNFEVGIDQFL